jgi:hypothetical protein
MRACLSWNHGFKKDNARTSVLTIARHTAYAWVGRNCPAALVVADDLEAMDLPGIACGSVEVRPRR